MIDAGIGALADAHHRPVSDEMSVRMVYSAMAESRETRIGEITRETAYNIRGVAESLERCDRRLLSHFPEEIMYRDSN